MHRKRVVLTGFGLLLTGVMLLSSCAFFKKTISDLSDLDAKTAEADSAAQGDTKDPGASDPENADNASDTAEKQEPSAAKDTASDAPAAASVKDAIVGSWSVDHLEDADGNTVGFDALLSDQSALSGMMAKFLKKGTVITFTEDGKLKCGVLSVRYSFDSANTISLSGGILPQSYSGIFVTASDDSAGIRIGNYTVCLSRT